MIVPGVTRRGAIHGGVRGAQNLTGWTKQHPFVSPGFDVFPGEHGRNVVLSGE